MNCALLRALAETMLKRYKKMMEDAGVRHGETHQLRGVNVRRAASCASTLCL